MVSLLISCWEGWKIERWRLVLVCGSRWRGSGFVVVCACLYLTDFLLLLLLQGPTPRYQSPPPPPQCNSTSPTTSQTPPHSYYSPSEQTPGNRPLDLTHQPISSSKIHHHLPHNLSAAPRPALQPACSSPTYSQHTPHKAAPSGSRVPTLPPTNPECPSESIWA